MNRWRLLDRRSITLASVSASEGAPSSSVPTSTSQWAPEHGSVQDTPPWDGRSPQYVTPSMLFNSSPNHSQEPHPAAYRPEQILSGAHLASANNSPPHPQLFQYGPSSLGGLLSHPGSVAHSPNPYAYHPQTTFRSHDHDTSRGSDDNVSAPNRSREYSSGDFEAMALPGSCAIHGTPEVTQQEDSLQNTSSVSNHEDARPSLPRGLLCDAGLSVAISDSPASPSPVASPLPLDTLPVTPPTEYTGLPSATVPSHSTHAPRCYYRTEAEKAQLAIARKASASQRPTRLSSLLPATTE